MISGRLNGPMHPGVIEESPMRNVLWICAVVASTLTLADARAEGEGLAARADRVPWARFQSRIAFAPGAPGWRADLVVLEAPSYLHLAYRPGVPLVADVLARSGPVGCRHPMLTLRPVTV